MTSATRDQVEILGSRVDRVTMDAALDRIEAWIADPPGTARLVIVTGFHGIWVGQQDPGFRDLMNGADLFCPDGIAPVWLSRLRGDPLPERIPGADLMRAFFERANERGYGSFFYGDTDETLTALCGRLLDRYPGHRIVGTCSPPFRVLTPEEDNAIVDQINAARPDVLWVGLGLPKQERWIEEHRDRLRVPVAIGVGAAFGFLSGNVTRAPKWLGDAGFEWVWRFIAEPRKLWRRDLLDGPRFLFYGLREGLAHRGRREKRSDDQAGGRR